MPELSAVRDTEGGLDRYLAHYSQLKSAMVGKEPPWLGQIRERAAEGFSRLGFPSPRQEEWRYTDVGPIRQGVFESTPAESNGINAETLEQITLGRLECPRLVFVDGHFSVELSRLEGLPEEVRVASLAHILAAEPDLVEPYLARFADHKEHFFMALNAAFMGRGALVYVPDGKLVNDPIHLMYLSTAADPPLAIHPRNLVVAGDNSQVAVLESYIGLGQGSYFTNQVTELVAGQNAIVDHYRFHQESQQAFHISMLQIQQARNSNVRAFNATLGGALTRNEVNVVLDGEGAECSLDGLFVLAGRQHVDNHTRLEHARAHCDSRELYRGILDEKATGVFHGRIVVQPGAQKTDSKQSNDNLLLSDQALINTKPQLEIYADDVKCTHGATVGQLDEEAIFYLRSRGIDETAARSLLTYAFASQVVNRIRMEAVRTELDAYLFSWLPEGHLVKEAI